MTLDVEVDREADGRWIGEVPELPGVLVYGSTREEAISLAEKLAVRVIAERLENCQEISATGRTENWHEVPSDHRPR